MELGPHGRRLLEARYLRRDGRGRVIESPEAMCARVADAVAAAERRFDPRGYQHWRAAFLEALAGCHFLPNSPTLMNAGTPVGQLAACFVLPLEDSLDSIFGALHAAARIQHTGGGTGFDFSALRPAGSLVSSTGGASAGPLGFLRLFDLATQTLCAGARRRGANMAVLRADHPDAPTFVRAKRGRTGLDNFNLSLGASDAFMRAVENDTELELRRPGERVGAGRLRARTLFDELVESAWRSGDPGLLFLDALERDNPTPWLGPLTATNPCGEVPLLPEECCHLGSLNLEHLVRRGASAPEFDWDALRARVRLAVRFLDDVVEVDRYPLPRLASAARRTRKIGLGVMGLARVHLRLGLPYGSERSIAFCERLASELEREARAASRRLAERRGPCPAFASRHTMDGGLPRNATTIAIAPTGSLSLIAGTSSGIEPLFALAHRRHGVVEGEVWSELEPMAVRWLEERGLDPSPLLLRGRMSDVPGVDADTRALFATALELPAESHLAVQAAFQRHADNAVSKTVNLPESSTAADVAEVLRRAHQLGLKGVTVFRDGADRRRCLVHGAGAAMGLARQPSTRERAGRPAPGGTPTDAQPAPGTA